jgi:dihydrolipoamide dehydrogenase
MKKNKIKVLNGVASFVDQKTVQVSQEGADPYTVTGKNIIIATGSKPFILPNITIDKECIITSTEALSLKKIPEHLIIIGAGVIGVELGSVYARLGSNVRVIDFADRILASMDSSVSEHLHKSLVKQGFEFYLKHLVKSVENLGQDGVQVTAEDDQGKKILLKGDYCLVAVGRKPYTKGLNIERAGVTLDAKGRIVVNEKLETNIKGIYAIGDVIDGPMLAHKASEEGIYVAETIAGQKPHINYRNIPGIIYTWPEAASVGFTEEQLKESGRDYKAGSFPFMASGRAIISEDTEGMVKVLSDSSSGEILGIHVVGPRASDIIGEASLALEYRASAEDIARTSHGHPTYYEALKEACMAIGDGAIHY